MSKLIPVAIVGAIVIIVSVLFVEKDIKEPPSMDVDIKVCSKWAEKVFKEVTEESEKCKIAFEKAKKEFDRIYQTKEQISVYRRKNGCRILSGILCSRK